MTIVLDGRLLDDDGSVVVFAIVVLLLISSDINVQGFVDCRRSRSIMFLLDTKLND